MIKKSVVQFSILYKVQTSNWQQVVPVYKYQKISRKCEHFSLPARLYKKNA